MARLNIEAAIRNERLNKSYEKMLILLKSKEGNEIFPDSYSFLEYLTDQESRLLEAENKITKYREFFTTLSQFLPKQMSISSSIF